MDGIVRLENAFWSLALMPERGASVIACECLGFPVFRPATKAFYAGNTFGASCFALLPFSNRIENGQFSFAGRDYSLIPNHPNHDYPIHGNTWELPWTVDEVSGAQCRLSLDYTPIPGGWPWAFHAEQAIFLIGDQLTFKLSLTNTDTEAFPAGIGLHPFFSNAETAEIWFEFEKMWDCDERVIPTNVNPLATSNDFSEPRKINRVRFDNCFEGWGGLAEINWPEFEGIIQMQADTGLSNLVVYIQPERNFFCLEPVSHINNALNTESLGNMKVLNSGDHLSGLIRFRCN